MAIIGYNIYKEGNKVNTELITDLFLSFTGQSFNTIYDDFTIRSVDDGGLESEPLSNTPFLTKPGQVQGLTATVNSDTQITLNWTNISGDGAFTYTVYRGTSTGVLTPIEFNVSTNSYVDEGLTADTEYFYAVLATNVTGDGDLSNETSVITENTPVTEVPDQPTNLITLLNVDQVELSWTNGARSETTTVERSLDGSTNWIVLDSEIIGNTYIDNTIDPLTDYFYRVKNVNIIGNSIYSDVVQVVNFQDFTVDLNTTVFSKQEYGVFVKRPANQLYTPTILYNNGDSYLATMDYAERNIFLIKYSEIYGLDMMHKVKGTDFPNTHHDPILYIKNNRIYTIQEENHGLANLQLRKAREDNDYLFYDKLANIGDNVTHPEYANIFEQGNTLVIAHQYDDIEAGYDINNTGNIESGWQNTIKIMERGPGEDERYQLGLYNKKAFDRFRIVSVGRNDDQPPSWFCFNVFDGVVNANGRLDWYTVDGRLIKEDGTMTFAEAQQSEIYNTGSEFKNGYIPVPANDSVGNFYMQHSDGEGNEVFSYWLKNSTTPVSKIISLPDSPVYVREDSFATITSPQGGAGAFMMPFSVEKVWIFVKTNNGINTVLSQYQTTDLGDSWTKIQDIDFGFDFVACQTADNFFEIGNNKNFILAAGGVPSSLSDKDIELRIKKVCFGSLQPELGNIYNDTALITESSFNSTAKYGSYFIESGKITNTGTVINSIIDQGPNLLNINSEGSPAIDSDTDPSEVIMDGVNDNFSLGTARFGSDSEIVFFGLFDNLGNNVAMFTSSWNTDNNNFLTPQISNTTNKVTIQARYNNTQQFVVLGSDNLNVGYNLVAIVMRPNSSYVVYLNGKKQDRRDVLNRTILEGAFKLLLWNRVNVGKLERTTNSFYNMKFKHFSFHQLNSEREVLERIKFLANKYSITIEDWHQ